MQSNLFHTTAFIDGYNQLCTLMDPGSSIYASIAKTHVDRLKLKTLDIPPRTVTGFLNNVTGTISKVATFSLDIGGIHNSIWAYVVPNQEEDLMLGMPWMKHHDATLNTTKDKIHFNLYKTTLTSNEALAKDPQALGPKPTLITDRELEAMAKSEKDHPDNLQIFAASMADIEKALRPKVHLSMGEILQQLPDHYKSFAPIFDPKEASQLPPHRPNLDHEIPLEKDDKGQDKQVPWGPLYNMTRDELLVLRKELASLSDKGFIQQSKSPAAAPVLFAKKPGGGLRFCVDYRRLNAITRKDRYPLPLIKETLSALNKAKWLTKLDVSAAFHKIRMAKGEEWKTAFRTRYGLFEWKVCPFGLTGSPATFQRYINWVLRQYLDDFCSAYVDDIMVFTSGSLKDHREKVTKVLTSLLENGLHLDLSKCEFETKRTKYLGYIVEVGEGIKMDPDKVKAITNWEPPVTVKGVRSFLGFANYYRLFIKGFAGLAKPLTDLTKKGEKFIWTQECQQAFTQLKTCFQKEPVLATFNPELETQLEPDSSGWAVGGALTQLDPTLQIWKPVAFYSAKHLPAECNYDIHDKELLAIVKCIKEWSSELRGLYKPFTILTDHKNLEPFTTKKTLNERQMRWSNFLAPYNFILKHRPGAAATIPDALSRRDQDVPKDGTDARMTERERTLLPSDLWINTTNVQDPSELQCPFTDDNSLQTLWQQALQTEDIGTAFLQAYNTILNNQRQFPIELGLRMATGECEILGGLLKYRERIWIPNHEPLTTQIIQKIHDSFLSGHPGRDATIALVSRKFFWPGLNQDIRQFVKNCDTCGRSTIWRDKKKGLLKPLPIPSQIWQELSMDFITGLPPSGPEKATTLLVITDRLSKALCLLPVGPTRFDAEGVAKIFLHHYVPHHWIPKAIVSDRGPQFVNAFWKQLCGLLDIKQRLSTAYHPETDGSTERANQEIETYLRTFVTYKQDDWVDWIPLAQIAINNKPAASTQISPFFLSHGYHAEPIATVPHETGPITTPMERGQAVVAKLVEAQEFAQSAMAVAQQNQEYYANAHRSPPPSYQVGDKVWLHMKNITTSRPSKKLDWIHGKFTITKVFHNAPHFYELDTPKGIFNRFHTSLLRPAHQDPLPSQVVDDSQPPGILTDAGDQEFGIDHILRARSKKIGRGQRREVLVKWTGYAQPSWHPLRDFQDTVALETFEAKYGDAHTHDGPTEGEGG